MASSVRVLGLMSWVCLGCQGLSSHAWVRVRVRVRVRFALFGFGFCFTYLGLGWSGRGCKAMHRMPCREALRPGFYGVGVL